MQRAYHFPEAIRFARRREESDVEAVPHARPGQRKRSFRVSKGFVSYHAMKVKIEGLMGHCALVGTSVPARLLAWGMSAIVGLAKAIE
jgi:hypothetical protein